MAKKFFETSGHERDTPPQNPPVGHRSFYAKNDGFYDLDSAGVETKLTNDSGGGLPYLVYTALLTQSGTNAPTDNVYQNTIGNIVITRPGAGQFRFTLNGAFTTNKTDVDFPLAFWNNNNGVICFSNISITNNYIEITTQSASDSAEISDMVNAKTRIEIRVYP